MRHPRWNRNSHTKKPPTKAIETEQGYVLVGKSQGTTTSIEHQTHSMRLKSERTAELRSKKQEKSLFCQERNKHCLLPNTKCVPFCWSVRRFGVGSLSSEWLVFAVPHNAYRASFPQRRRAVGCYYVAWQNLAQLQYVCSDRSTLPL